MKKNYFKKLLSGSLLTMLLFLSVGQYNVNAATIDLQLTINGGVVTIGAPSMFDFGAFTVSSAIQTVDKQFGIGEYFFVDDVKGADLGYYTTLQSTALAGANGSISNTNIFVQADSVTATTLSGTTNSSVVVSPASYTSLSSPVTFIKRDTASNAGKIGKYGSLPMMRVNIPAYQAVGTYTGTLTYTLIEN